MLRAILMSLSSMSSRLSGRSGRTPSGHGVRTQPQEARQIRLREGEAPRIARISSAESRPCFFRRSHRRLVKSLGFLEAQDDLSALRAPQVRRRRYVTSSPLIGSFSRPAPSSTCRSAGRHRWQERAPCALRARSCYSSLFTTASLVLVERHHHAVLASRSFTYRICPPISGVNTNIHSRLSGDDPPAESLGSGRRSRRTRPRARGPTPAPLARLVCQPHC